VGAEVASVGLRDIPEPYRVPILERLARDGDDYAMYALSFALPRGEDGKETSRALQWRWRAARTLLAAQWSLLPSEWGENGRLLHLRRDMRAWVRNGNRLRHPQWMRALAWTSRDLVQLRLALGRAARAGSPDAAYDVAMRLETLAGDLRVVRSWLRLAIRLGLQDDREVQAEALVRRARPFLRRFGARPDAWRERAAAGDPEGLLLVGYARRFGRGEPFDPAGALPTFEAAAQAGSVEAAIVLALSFLHHWEVMDYEVATAWAVRAAASGDPVALALAGDMASMETPALKRRAVGWLRRAAGAGQTRSAHRLACGHAYGGFVPKDLAAAERWARVAANAGHEGGMSLLARLLEEKAHPTPRERREAIAWRRCAASRGSPDDWTNYGVRLHEGKGVRRDDREAVRWYRRAAAQGCDAATANLGRCYRRGHGVRKSPRLAARWFRRAAEVFDSAQAAGCLGDMYRKGELGRPDVKRAFVWYRRAAARGDAEGLRELGIAYHESHGVAKDHDFAALLYRAATDAGDGWGAYCLGQCYRDGEGVRRNPRSAARWFRVAIERKVKPARRALVRLHARVTKGARP